MEDTVRNKRHATTPPGLALPRAPDQPLAVVLGEVLAPDERQRLAQFLGESVDSFGSAS